MRILVDENLPRSLAERLRAAGHDAVDIREPGEGGASDPAIMALASRARRAIVSGNYKHFGNIVLFPPAKSAGILVVRMPKSTIKAVIARIEEVLAAVSDDALRGSLLIVEPDRLRRRG